ncbi:DUF4058 family protein [Oscillatoria sp. CS-180]|uniref:DUF4058 family protein n=1 Tax=Oscillatoria sp. CS-180 TaxID=3021720 RepID=UPI002330BBDD|nr:DUF4058 family protein [Oscillatoria sp. CS-180]MDB9528015.1 DUF4058 family protein [Oscillatoria sp. CS-180]
MANPFPGMNPYLEQSDYWSDFHNQLIAAIARTLIPQLLPKYRVVTDKWVYTITDDLAIALGRPDVSIQQRRQPPPPLSTTAVTSVQPIKVSVPLPVEVQQSFLEVKDTATQSVVTVLEVLSPANKYGEGRSQYQAKRQQILESSTHLVEIDLLRSGKPFLLKSEAVQSHYRILVSQAQHRPVADLYPFDVSVPIPAIPLPLRSEDGDILLDVQTVFNGLYEQLGYDYFIDYAQSPPRPWSWDDIMPFLSSASGL